MQATSKTNSIRPVTNICEYVAMRVVRQNTGERNGMIIYNGEEMTKEEYYGRYPDTPLIYDSTLLSGKQIEQ